MGGTISVKDVAARAGVSVGTVSNVLNRPDRVSPETRDRVSAAIAELGFVRNESARHLRAGSSRTVGLVVLDVANPFFTDVARGVEDTASAAGLAVILCNTDEKTTKEEAYLELLEEQRVRGILITPADAISDRLTELRRRGTPVVLLDRKAAARDQCSVSVDDRKGGDLAVTHLVESGHRRIAFVGGPLAIAQVADRLRGARAAVKRAGLPETALIISSTVGHNVAAGRLAVQELLTMAKRKAPTAMFCANDLLALGALQELSHRGVRIPADMAIVGYDDIDFASAAMVPLSSVRQPRHQLGRTAAELLIEETDKAAGHKHRQVVFEPELIVRESSRRVRRTSS
ncbi:MAG: LacI family transcriptional regulator [Frankiales bacterium]|nr:LacI family transcriptional regulator [Frankiales bacterium]MDX6212155.1 LacI family transcriptional regulator [Frankiales bacterium]